MSEVLINVENLKKYFPTSDKEKVVKAVDDISFQIFKGETLGVVGESGCGKSTTGRLDLQLQEPTEGKVQYNGQELTTMTRKQLRPLRKEMQIIFQDPYASLDPRKTVLQILAEPFEIHNPEMSKDEIFDKVAELVKHVGLRPEHIYRYPHEFSGGQRQRVGIARAIALNPEFVVCDEPVSALDVSIQAQVINLMADLKKQFNLTYMFISHDLRIIKHFCDRVMVMYLGNIVEIGTKDAIYGKRRHPYTKALLSAIPIPDLDHQQEQIIIRGEVTSPINLPDACRFHKRCDVECPMAESGEPPLVEVRPNHFVACYCVKG